MSKPKNPDYESAVKGVRATPQQWKRWIETARVEQKSTNKFIVEATEQYCDICDGRRKRRK